MQKTTRYSSFPSSLRLLYSRAPPNSPKNGATKRCNLCLNEKLSIICKPYRCTLNWRNELVSLYRHRTKSLQCNNWICNFRLNQTPHEWGCGNVSYETVLLGTRNHVLIFWVLFIWTGSAAVLSTFVWDYLFNPPTYIHTHTHTHMPSYIHDGYLLFKRAWPSLTLDCYCRSWGR